MNVKYRFHLPGRSPTRIQMQRRISLKHFLVGWVRAIVGGSMLVIVLGVVFFVYQTESRSWLDRQGEAIENAALTVNLFLQDNYEILTTLSRIDIQALTEYPQILQENLNESPGLQEIVYLNQKGHVLATAFKDRPIIANFYTIQQSRWFLQTLTGHNYLGDVQFTATNDPYIILAVPTPNHGVVAARLEMKMLQGVVTSIHFGSTGQTFIVDSRGAIIAHPDPKVVERQVNVANLPVFKKMLAAPNSQWQGVFQNFLGQSVVGSSTAILGTNWVIITEISRHEAYTTTLRAVTILGSILLLIGALVNLAATHLLQVAIINRITALSGGAARIGKGDLDYRIPVTFNDEIGDVSQAFNQMAANLTERELALEQARDEALFASQFKSRLLANVGHDLRTPINSILGYADIMTAGVYGSLNPQQQKAANRILSSSRRLINLVNSMLDQAQIDVGKITLVSEPFAPRDILLAIQEGLDDPAHAKGVTLQTECSPDLPEQMIGDPQRLQQIVWNLVENGLKFTQQGSVSVCFDRSNLTHWSITVRDTGVGIPPEAQEYIFEAFRQVDGSTTRENKGVGLGLSIVKQLTLLMGGSVQLQSQAGLGSTFTVLLPLVTETGPSAINHPSQTSAEEMRA